MSIDKQIQEVKTEIAVNQLAALAQLIAFPEDKLKENMTNQDWMAQTLAALHISRHALFALMDEEARAKVSQLMVANVDANTTAIMDVIDKIVGNAQTPIV